MIDLLAVVEVIVYQPSVGIESCHLFRSGFEDLGERRMDVDHVGEFGKSGVLAHQNRNLLDDVGGVGTVGVTAHDPSIVGRSEELQHTLGLTHGEGLAVGTPEGLLADVRDALGLELVLRGAYTGSLGIGEDSGGHDVETDAVSLAQNMIDGTHGLHLCGMGKHLTTVDVADSIEVRGKR